MELIFGNTLQLSTLQQFQNYAISDPNFLPFGFSGTVQDRQGDNVTATLVFPNTPLTRPWVTAAIDGKWLAVVEVKLLHPGQSPAETLLYTYTGQVTAGGWDEIKVTMELSTVLDAVGGDIPFRTLTQELVGPLPTSQRLSL
jgi:hypothetical protein